MICDFRIQGDRVFFPGSSHSVDMTSVSDCHTVSSRVADDYLVFKPAMSSSPNLEAVHWDLHDMRCQLLDPKGNVDPKQRLRPKKRDTSADADNSE